jgi:hypothetical protein
LAEAAWICKQRAEGVHLVFLSCAL